MSGLTVAAITVVYNGGGHPQTFWCCKADFAWFEIMGNKFSGKMSLEAVIKNNVIELKNK